jgi:hypothetical protein
MMNGIIYDGLAKSKTVSFRSTWRNLINPLLTEISR